MTPKQEHGKISYEGYCIDLMNELAETLHFTYEIYPSPDGLYGAETKNGTWNGMIRELVNKVFKLKYCLRRFNIAEHSFLLLIRYLSLFLKQLKSERPLLDDQN